MSHVLPLDGLNGANPLAFLAALGTLALTAQRTDLGEVRLGWSRCGIWRPTLHTDALLTAQDLAARLADGLRGKAPDPAADRLRAEADAAHQKARKRLKDALEAIKGRRLSREEARVAVEHETAPLRVDAAAKRAAWLNALQNAVASPELALGKDLSATRDEFRAAAQEFARRASPSDRAAADLAAAFGSDGCFDERSGRIEATPFCFVTGSGHQYFLATVGELMERVDAARVAAALFEPWRYEDGKLSLRWDPAEDRRYALMWADPTSAGNEARTVWAANLLAYHGLRLLPGIPGARHLATTGFRRTGRKLSFTWPLWDAPASLGTVRSLLSCRVLQEDVPDRAQLAAIGVAEIFRSERIQVGTPPLHKINFAPSRPV